MNWTEINTFEDMLVSANTYSPFWAMMLFMIWSVLIITFMPYGTIIAIMAGSFVAFFLGLFLAYMGLVAWEWVLALIGLVIAIIIGRTLFGKKNVT